MERSTLYGNVKMYRRIIMSDNSLQNFFDLPVYQDDIQTMLEKHNIEKLYKEASEWLFID